MLSSVLRTDVAVSVSIGIMRAFVEMRKFLAENSHLIERITSLEEKQIIFQTETESKFSRVFQYIEDHAESVQKLFFEGQIYDAFSFLSSLVEKAENSIILIDNFVNIETLNVLSKKRPGTVVAIYTQAGCPLTDVDISQFNKQYPDLRVHITKVFHDRFLIIDNKAVYHIGASLKDAGKKCFAVSAMKDENLCSALMKHLQAF